MRNKPLGAILVFSLLALPFQAAAAREPFSVPIGTAMAQAVSGRHATAKKSPADEEPGATAFSEGAVGNSYLAITLGALGIAALTAVLVSGGDSGKPVSS